MRRLSIALFSSTFLLPAYALAQQVPTSPPVNFVNSTTPATGTTLTKVLDAYTDLMVNHPEVMVKNYQTVVSMTQNRTAAQTEAAIRADRTSQAYNVMNGLGPLTNFYLTGAGASTSGTAPQSLTPTTYVAGTLADYQRDINFLSNASAGSQTFGNGTKTPLASAVNFIDNIARANASTEPAKRTFDRYQGATPAINPLDSRYQNYSAATKTGLTTADTASFVVPGYLSQFTVPAAYGTVDNWVKGFTVTAAMVAANGGQPISVPNVGSYDAAGNFTPTLFNVGDYVPGIGTSPRPFRVTSAVNIPTLLYQRINGTNPYADGGFPSGHTNSGYLQSYAVAFLVPQRGQEMLMAASELGNNRILAGMHSPLDVIGGRMESSAIVATNIYGALYDSTGNRLDWTNPANASAYAVYQAYNDTQNYLAASCNAVSVQACIQQAQAAGFGATDPLAYSAANKALYTARLTYGLPVIGPVKAMTAADVPVQAQVLLLTRFPYLSDAQRTEILATTALPSGYAQLSGNTYDGWGQLNLYAAFDGYGAFNSQVNVTMDASLGGYNAADAWRNDITGTGGLTKGGTGQLTLSGNNTYTGPTVINGGYLIVNGSIVSPTTVNSGGTLGGTGRVGNVTVNGGGTLMPGTLGSAGTLTVNGNLAMAANSKLLITATPTTTSNVQVNGTATLQGGTVQVGAAGTFLPFTQVALVSATGGVSGQFAGVTTSGSNLTSALSYDAKTVTLTMNRTDVNYATVAATANQRSVGTALNAAAPSAATAAAGTLVNGVFLSNQASAGLGQAALDSVSGAGLTASQGAALQATSAFTSNIQDQQDTWFTYGRTAPAASASSPALNYAAAPKTKFPPVKAVPAPAPEPRWNVWGGAFGSTTSIDAAPGLTGQSSTTWGGLVGLDYRVQPDWLVGIALGGSTSQFSTTSLNTSGTVDGAHLSLYTTYAMPSDSYVRGVFTFSGFSNDVKRVAGGVGALAVENEKGSFDSYEARVRGEIGKRFGFGAFGVTPFAAMEFATLNSSAFNEVNSQTGTVGNLSLQVNGQSTQSAPLFLGARFDAAMPMDGGRALRADATLAYVHDFYSDRSLTNSFVALPGSSFLVQGVSPSADAVQTKVGLEFGVTANTAVFANFNGLFSDNSTSYAGSGGLKMQF
ncbi:outer membrane autotransporter protein [Azorhizobium sp. AG788]|nr:outer membrane autotransporter protein [Azorhizobium sp. AG788]